MSVLPSRRLGSIEVSAVSLGCMGLNHGYGDFPSEVDGIRLLNHALDAGVTMLDTAALYGDGENERLVARAVGHRRREYTLASKCVLGVFDGKRGLDGRPEAIARTLDGALERLRTDHIDLYYLHRLDRTVPIEESVGALARAVEAGKIGGDHPPRTRRPSRRRDPDRIFSLCPQCRDRGVRCLFGTGDRLRRLLARVPRAARRGDQGGELSGG